MKRRNCEKEALPGYREALAELELLVAKIEDPSTKIEDIAPIVKRSLELTGKCRDELRKYGDEIDKLQNG